MKVALIPCASTEWQGAGRLLGRTELPLTEAGQEQCSNWAARLAPEGIGRILHAPDELATQTAAMVARPLSVPTKPLEDLMEVDVGLWAGLTESQLKSRYATAHRELRESPLNVNPPGGESLGEAAERLVACIRKQLRRNGKTAIGVVVRPFSFAMAKCALEGADYSDVWDIVRRTNEPIIIELEPQAAGAKSEV